MLKLVMIVSALPFVAAGFAANAFGFRVLLRPDKVSLEVDVLMRKLLAQMQREDIEIIYQKKQLWPNLSSGKLHLPASFKKSKKASHVGRALQLLGVILLGEQQPEPVIWREKMLKLGYTLPVFTLLVIAFAFLVGKMPSAVLFTIASASLGFTSVMLGLSMGVDKEAAHLMVDRVEKLRVLPRLSEEELVVAAIKASPWAALMPGVFLKLTLKD